MVPPEMFAVWPKPFKTPRLPDIKPSKTLTVCPTPLRARFPFTSPPVTRSTSSPNVWPVTAELIVTRALAGLEMTSAKKKGANARVLDLCISFSTSLFSKVRAIAISMHDLHRSESLELYECCCIKLRRLSPKAALNSADKPESNYMGKRPT